MAYRSTKRRASRTGYGRKSGGAGTRRRATSSTRRKAPARRAAPQTVRIVIENAPASSAGVGRPDLPAVVETPARKAKF